MSRRTTSRVAAAAAALLLGTGCPPTQKPPPDDFDRAALLQSLGEHVVLPTLRQFTGEAESLHLAAGGWVDALGAGNAAEKRDAARAAWRAAMATWQQAELMQVGPAGGAGSVTGGRSLRDELYSWPTVNPCRVDQELVANGFETAGFFDAALVNTYGLAALEYLLFNESTSNACPIQATINQDGSWAALSAEERSSRRARYARAAAAFLVQRAEELRNAWEPSSGDFLARFAGLGRAGTEETFAAMFYLDLVVKDEKLALPAGLDTACLKDSCPEALESRWALHSKEHLLANLRGFRRMLIGNGEGEQDRMGFDDWLVHRGAPEVSEALVRDVDGAIAKLDAIADLRAAVESDVERVREVHAEVKKVTDLLKSQFLTVLDLSAPDGVPVDND